MWCLLIAFKFCESFQSSSRNLVHSPCRGIISVATNKRDISLAASLFGKKENETPVSSSLSHTDTSIPTRVFRIPVQSIKQGGLRFALGLHLIGLQNTPDKGSWKANEASNSVLHMSFKDNSAMLSITLGDDGIFFDRYGKPSLPYLLQESVILHSILDEINSLANEGDVEEENRLLRLQEESGDAIEEARDTLPARKA